MDNKSNADYNKTQLDKDIKKEADRLDYEKYDTLAKQCNAEFEIAYAHQKPKKDEDLLRLKLYNNQRRDKKAAGDTTMFSIFQTVLASLYVDRLTAVWSGREEGDADVADNLNALYEYDYTEMGKDESDYEWDWDTLFFRRGLSDMSEYIRDPENNIYLPVPRTIDPMVFLRDPRAASVNGNRMRKGAARFMYEEVKMNRDEIEENPHAVSFRWDELKFGSGTKSLIEAGAQARADAQNNQYEKNKNEKNLGANAEYDITIGYTHWKVDGNTEKVKVWLANNRKLVVGFQVLKTSYWKIIDRPLYPTSHEWDGTSIPDLTEDKQRARAVAQNLGMEAMKADLYPMYIYDSNKIKNKSDLNFNFNKFIPADVPEGRSVLDAIAPMRKSAPNLQLLNFIYQSLDTSAQKATATSDVQQGIQSQADRPLGETNLVAAKGDTRYSLAAKIFGWSERRQAMAWYNCYKENFSDDIDEKVIRIEGAFGAKWRKLTKDQITTEKVDPDVKIDSVYVSRAKQLEERQSLTTYFAMVMQDPTANKRYALKELGTMGYGLTKDRLDRLLPPTIDERIAEGENDLLNDNKYVQVKVEDDHMTHLEIHSKAAATAATYAHIETHKKALSIKKVQPQLFPADPAPYQIGPPGQAMNKPIAPSQTSAQPAAQPVQ
jgi:hypothetical protein